MGGAREEKRARNAACQEAAGLIYGQWTHAGLARHCGARAMETLLACHSQIGQARGVETEPEQTDVFAGALGVGVRKEGATASAPATVRTCE